MSTSIELLALGLRQRGETIAQHHYGRQSHIENRTHDALLPWRDGRRNKYTTSLSISNVTTDFGLQLLGRKATGDAHILSPRSGKQGAVTYAVVRPGTYLPIKKGA